MAKRDLPPFETCNRLYAIRPERKERSGSVFLPDSRDDGETSTGTVIATYRSRTDRKGRRRTPSVSVGARVTYERRRAESVRLYDHEVHLVPEDALLLVRVDDRTVSPSDGDGSSG